MTRREYNKKNQLLYRRDPILFFRKELNFDPDEWQRKVALDVANNSKVSVRSGQGVGKTGLEAALVLWFLACFKNSRVVCTAPTRQQLHDVLWSEIAKWQTRSRLMKKLLRWTKTRVYVVGEGDQWFAVARTATKPENMQGFHADNMLFVVDEASGVADDIMEAINGTLTGENNKLLMCGNPTKSSGAFYDSFHKNRKLYKCHRVSSLDSKRTNKENIEALIDNYGEESNVVRVRVRGDFPLADDDVFIPLTMVESAVFVEKDHDGDIVLGVDVARYGSDKTVIATKVGNVIELPEVKHGQDLMRTVGDIVVTYRKILEKYPEYQGQIAVNIDDTGLGGGVTDRLREVKDEDNLIRMDINAINFGGKVENDEITEKTEKYANVGAWLWGKLRGDLRNEAISIPSDAELIAQLSTRKYTISSKGVIVLESKEAMKKRRLPSPDKAEAVALAVFKPKPLSWDIETD